MRDAKSRLSNFPFQTHRLIVSRHRYTFYGVRHALLFSQSVENMPWVHSTRNPYLSDVRYYQILLSNLSDLNFPHSRSSRKLLQSMQSAIEQYVRRHIFTYTYLQTGVRAKLVLPLFFYFRFSRSHTNTGRIARTHAGGRRGEGDDMCHAGRFTLWRQRGREVIAIKICLAKSFIRAPRERGESFYPALVLPLSQFTGESKVAVRNPDLATPSHFFSLSTDN